MYLSGKSWQNLGQLLVLIKKGPRLGHISKASQVYYSKI